MDDIMEVAKINNLYEVEDNAQAHLTSYNGQLAGSFGDVNRTSFYTGKDLGALGDADVVTTNNESLANRKKRLRKYGSSVKYYNEEIAYNNRLDELWAAFISVKLNYLEDWTKKRKEIAKWYDELLCDSIDLILP